MNFAPSDEQRMLRDTTRQFLAERFPIERIVKLADGDGFDPAWWPEVADLGWTSISIPTEAGGAGMGLLEEMIVIEELGRALYPGPFFSTVVLALPALAQAGDLREEVVSGKAPATLAWAGADGVFGTSGLATRAAEKDGVWRLSGTTLFVPDLSAASLVVVAAEAEDAPGLWVVERDSEGSRWSELPTVDATRRLGALVLDEAPAKLVSGPGIEAVALLEHIRDRALAALAGEAVGLAGRALDMAVEHATTRKQFGRPVGSFQAVSHQLADAYVEVENARSLAYWAGWSVANAAEEASTAAAAAKGYAAEAAVRTCERAIQAHGGIGFTWDHPLHRFYRRALWITAFMGWPATQRARVAASLLD